MKQMLFGLFLMALLFLSMRREGFTSSTATLLEDTKGKKVLVLFYNNDCGHCKKLKPIWDKAESKMGDKMVSIDVTDNSDPSVQAITSKFNLTSYPTMLVVENGEEVGKYEGDRTEEKLIEFVNQL
jgi:thiol-disulfide isomerase/thioredoxin